MNNFLQFIEEDIQNKKTLFSSMPTNNKSNIRKFNQKLEDIASKYDEYLIAIKRYLDIKSKSFDIKYEKNTEAVAEVVKKLEYIRFILNPYNTYFEKIGFDTLFYQITNYHDFKFNSLNQIINEFFNRFELAGITLQSHDFDYTCYVNEFMTSFLNIRSLKTDNYDMIAEIFEKIYWTNPELVGHIELNFRKLIKKHEKRFIEYIKKLQQEIIAANNINYDSCLDKLAVAYRELNTLEKENITDIVELAKLKKIDINNYFEDSKIRTTTFNNLMIDLIDLNNPTNLENFYDDLEKLKSNVLEYGNYLKFIPLIDDFKKEYLKAPKTETSKNDKNKVDLSKNLKDIETEISQNETKLSKLNKKIFGEKGKVFERKDSILKELKFESVKQANVLYDLYKKLDQEYFKNKVLAVLNNAFTVSDLLNLYYSFDYFKKAAIKKVFNIATYDEIIEYSDSFNSFAMNPTNMIVDGISLYEESNVAKVIVNKYRLDNINITEEDLNGDSLSIILDKIEMLLRVQKIEKSPLDVEKIWFIVQVAKIDMAEQKNN